MADFKKAILKILVYEGGYVNDPDDPGGETNMGIIDSLDGKTDGLIDVDGDGIGDVHVIELTQQQAKDIYKREFWDKMKGDEINFQPLAEILFDGYVNTGRRAIKQLQKILSIKEDGIVGPATITMVNSGNAPLLYSALKNARRQFYIDLAYKKPVLKKFLNGWLNRIDSFKTL